MFLDHCRLTLRLGVKFQPQTAWNLGRFFCLSPNFRPDWRIQTRVRFNTHNERHDESAPFRTPPIFSGLSLRRSRKPTLHGTDLCQAESESMDPTTPGWFGRGAMVARVSRIKFLGFCWESMIGKSDPKHILVPKNVVVFFVVILKSHGFKNIHQPKQWFTHGPWYNLQKKSHKSKSFDLDVSRGKWPVALFHMQPFADGNVHLYKAEKNSPSDPYLYDGKAKFSQGIQT